MAFKTFSTGEVLTSSDVNAYLMSQTVARVTSGTRPSSPVDGQRIWETDTGREMIYSGGSWVFYRGIDIMVYKSADETVTSSAVVQDDNHFINIPYEANASYMIRVYIIGQSLAAAGWRFSIVNQTGTYTHFWWSTTSPHSSAADSDHVTLSHAPLGGYPNSSGSIANMQGFGANILYPQTMFLRTSTAGTFKIQWAQATGNATGTIIRAGSYLYGQRVA